MEAARPIDTTADVNNRHGRQENTGLSHFASNVSHFASDVSHFASDVEDEVEEVTESGCPCIIARCKLCSYFFRCFCCCCKKICKNPEVQTCAGIACCLVLTAVLLFVAIFVSC